MARSQPRSGGGFRLLRCDGEESSLLLDSCLACSPQRARSATAEADAALPRRTAPVLRNREGVLRALTVAPHRPTVNAGRREGARRVPPHRRRPRARPMVRARLRGRLADRPSNGRRLGTVRPRAAGRPRTRAGETTVAGSRIRGGGARGRARGHPTRE